MQNRSLTQEEIDALVKSLLAGEEPSEAPVEVAPQAAETGAKSALPTATRQAGRDRASRPSSSKREPRNVELLLEIPLQVTVELGRTRQTVRQLLSLRPESVIVLDKMVGDPADVLVNGRLIAQGEVVSVDDFYGVRLTSIVSPVERVESLR